MEQVIALVLPWVATAVVCALLYTAIRQYGQALHARDDLSGRLAAVERALGELSAQVAASRVAAPDPHAGHQHAAPALPEGLPLGSDAPDFALLDLAGHQRTLRDFAGRSTVVVFFNPTCGFCEQMAPRLGQLPAEGGARVLVIGQGEAEAYRRLAAEHHWSCEVVLDPDARVAQAYRFSGTPTGYLLDAQGRVASELAIGADSLLGLLPAAAVLPSSNGHAKGRAEVVEILSAASIVAARPPRRQR